VKVNIDDKKQEKDGSEEIVVPVDWNLKADNDEKHPKIIQFLNLLQQPPSNVQSQLSPPNQAF